MNASGLPPAGPSALPDPSRLAQVQPLPNQTRHRIIEGAGESSIDWRDDQMFYGWLGGHYAASGTSLIDGILSRRGGKDARRTLQHTSIAWASAQIGVRPPRNRDPLRFLREQALRTGRDEIAEILAFVSDSCSGARSSDDGRTPDATATSSDDNGAPFQTFSAEHLASPPIPDGASSTMTADPSDSAAATKADEGEALAEVRAVLARLALEPLPAAMDVMVAAAREAEALIEARTARNRLESMERERTAALQLLGSVVERVSEGRRAMLPPPNDRPSGDLDLLGAAIVAVETLIECEEDLARAEDALRGVLHPGPERRNALSVVQTTELAAEAALEHAAAALAAATAGDPASTDSEPSPSIQQPPVMRDEEPAVDPGAPGSGSIHPGAPTPAEPVVTDDAVAHHGSEPVHVLSEETEAVDAPASRSITDNAAVEFEPETTEPGEAAQAPDPEWSRWVALALGSGHLGLAVHLADAQELAGAGSSDRTWPAGAVEALLVGRAVEAHADRSATRYAELAPQLAESARSLKPTTDEGFGLGMLLLAGAMRACMVAPYAGIDVVTALRANGAIGEFHDLAAFLERAPQLNLEAVRELATGEDRQAREKLRGDVVRNLREWHDAARSRTLAYQPATRLWQWDLITPQGRIGRTVVAILEGRDDAVGLAQSLVADLRDRPEEILDEAFAAQLNRARGVRLEAAARERCLALFEETRELTEAWLATEPSLREGRDRLDDDRSELRSAIRHASSALGDLRAGADWTSLGAGLLGTTLGDLTSLLDAHPRALPLTSRILDEEIALLADFPLNGRQRFRVDIDDVEPLRLAARAALSVAVPTARQAFERALETGAATVAERLLPLVAAGDDADEHRLEAMSILQRRELRAKRDRLRTLLDDLQTASTGNDDEGLSLTELEATLVSLGEGPLDDLPREDLGVDGAVADFPILRSRLDEFGSDLEARRLLVSGRLADRVAREEVQRGIVLADCRALLSGGDLGTLAEELAQIDAYGPEKATTRPSELVAALGAFANDVLRMERPSFAEVCAHAREGDRFGPLGFDRLTHSEREGAARLLDGWIAFKRAVSGSGDAAPNEVLRVLSALGFGGARVAGHSNWRGAKRIEVEADPLRSSAACVIPAFGSQARGRYTLLAVPPKGLDRCMQSFDELPSEVIVLVAEWLPENSRTLFARTARSRPGASAALLDDAGAVALAATPGRGLRDFFDLAVPFGAAHPYADASLADAPPSIEMFFGRERELQQLVDAHGSCLVYGGRQLGKTALLKQIQMRFSGAGDLVVVYRSIENVGRSVQATDVWDLLSNQLSEQDVFPRALRGERAVTAGVRDWLAGSPSRRLLLLLDEADNFLENEINTDFPIITAMRRLMEETDRRAKFVFAGLHNVQRFVRTPNSPMLHLGAAVQIGPLLGHDRDAARRMVFEPMAAVGIGFEEAADAHHMLSLVGYYPSLLQTFGKTIVTRMSERIRHEDAIGLPHMLRREDITESFQDREFRKALVGKFKATLQLDQRYELITYAVCYRTEEDRRQGVVGSGYTEAEIRRLALEYWPQGFEGSGTANVFEALLDEMVGLGVLNRDAERYTLRSARIAAMLGGADQIMAELVEFGDRAPEHKSDPMANHRLLSAPRSYSPLSLRQEKVLVDLLAAHPPASPIVVMAGCRAAAPTGRLIEALATLAAAQGWPDPRRLETRSAADLTKVVGDIRREGRPGRPKIVLCSGQLPAASELAPLSRSRELRDHQHPVRIVFVGGADEMVRAEAEGEASALRTSGIDAIDVGPWDREAVHHWLVRQLGAAGGDIGLAEEVLEASGGFGGILEQVNLPRRVAPGDVVAHIGTTAAKVATSEALGFGAPWMTAFVRLLADYGGDFSDADLLDVEREADAAGAATASKRLGILRSVQRSGEPRYVLSAPVAEVARSGRGS